MNCNAKIVAFFRTNVESIGLSMLLLIHGLLLAGIAVVNAPMIDEIAHLPSGLSHWKSGNFDLYRVNPPLMRMIASIPLLFVNPKTDWKSISSGPYDRPEFSVGRSFMRVNGYDSFWYFTICRWAQIPVSILGGWICFRWARELFGKSSGYIAVILWSFCPNVLAWGSTITPDLGAATFGVAAAYTFWRWLCCPTWKSALIAGAVTGLAELTKSTWIILFALWPIVWICWRHCNRNVPASKPPVLQLIATLIIALYALNLGYGFENSFQRLDQFNFISRALGGADAREIPGNRFRNTLLGPIPVPVPANYLRGIDVQKYDFERGKWSYLRGEQKHGGWYHYYIYALAVKTPLGTLFLLGMACAMVVRRCEYALRFRDEMLLLIPVIAVLILVSSQTGFNRYLRYVLPSAPFLFIFASRVGKSFELKHRFSQAITYIAVAGSIAGSMSVYPYSMSFFNASAGGPLGGPAHLLDANIDWGQDLLELKRYVDQHPEVGTIGLAYFGSADPRLAQFPYETVPIPSVSDGRPRPLKIKPGWYAISVNHVFGYRHRATDQPVYTYFQKIPFHATVGYSIYIYHVTPEAIKRLNATVTSDSSNVTATEE